MSWEEMQSAPHDGTTIIVRYPLQGNVKRIASYNTRHKFWESNGEPFWPVQQHCQWAAIPPDVAAPSAANGAATCPACKGNDADMPCAYPSERVKGCVRDVRLSDNGAEMPEPTYFGQGPDGSDLTGYSADQLRAAVRAEREQIAKMVDSKHESISDIGIIGKDYSDCGHNVLTNIARLIRART